MSSRPRAEHLIQFAPIAEQTELAAPNAGGQFWCQKPVIGGFGRQLADGGQSDDDRRRSETVGFERDAPGAGVSFREPRPRLDAMKPG
jgi:hypothetical protein